MWGVLFYCLCINFILSLQALISLELDPQRAIMRALALAGTRKELMIVSTQTGIEMYKLQCPTPKWELYLH